MNGLAITLQQILDAFVDMAYLTDPGGRILAYNRTKWNDFALQNDAPELTEPSRVIGHSIYEFIAGRKHK